LRPPITTSLFPYTTLFRSLEHRSTMLSTHTRETIGLQYDEILQVARRADVLVNISGLLTDNTMLESIPLRLYLDLDPAFTQLWRSEEHTSELQSPYDLVCR